MTEYNFKGTYEPRSLDEVVGEAKELPSKSRRDIIIKNFKTATVIGVGSFFGELGVEYLEPAKPIIDVGNLLLRTLIVGGGLTGLYSIIKYAYKRNWSEASEQSAGVFVGFAVGYNMGYVISGFLK